VECCNRAQCRIRAVRLNPFHVSADTGALHQVAGAGWLGPPKSKAAVRDIRIPPAHTPSKPLFCTIRGRWMWRTTLAFGAPGARTFTSARACPARAGRLPGCWPRRGCRDGRRPAPDGAGQGVLVEGVGPLILGQLAQIGREPARRGEGLGMVVACQRTEGSVSFSRSARIALAHVVLWTSCAHLDWAGAKKLVSSWLTRSASS
jgi:hypothetical protein